MASRRKKRRKPDPAPPAASPPANPPLFWPVLSLAWLLAFAGAGAAAANVLGLRTPEPAEASLLAGTPPAAESELLDPLRATEEERRVLAYACGPAALAWALEIVAREEGVQAFDRGKAFERAFELADPQAGRGTTMLDLHRAASRMAPVMVQGTRFESPEKLLGALSEWRHPVAVVRLSPQTGRQMARTPTGHFAGLAWEEPGEEPGVARRWAWFDPLDGSAESSESLDREEALRRLGELSSGHALVFPR